MQGQSLQCHFFVFFSGLNKSNDDKFLRLVGNPKFPVDMVKFTKKPLMENFNFCAVFFNIIFTLLLNHSQLNTMNYHQQNYKYLRLV